MDLMKNLYNSNMKFAQLSANKSAEALGLMSKAAKDYVEFYQDEWKKYVKDYKNPFAQLFTNEFQKKQESN